MNEAYISRMNKVLAFIDENIDADLSLESIADVACYSPFHLHRLFKAITNETPNAYINRKRIEKAALLLIHKKELSISDISSINGFKSNSVFTRTFSKHYGQSPSQFRQNNTHNFSKISKTNSKNGKVNFITEEYLRNINHLKNWITMNAKINIQEIAPAKLAYFTQIGEAGIEKTFDKLIKWARSKGLLNEPNANIIRVFHDSFKITDADKVRMSIGVSVHRDFTPEGEISTTTIPGGKHIVAHYEIDLHEFENAWNSLFIWMTEQGYKKADKYPFEVYHNNPNDHPSKKYVVDFCIPIE